MNVKRFTARTSREALVLVRQSFGDDAVVMSTRPCAEGVEVLAMAPESVQQLERIGMPPETPRVQANVVQPRASQPAHMQAAHTAPPVRSAVRQEPSFDNTPVDQDVEQLQMSTLSFQDYVRQRMLKRREAQLAAEQQPEPAAPAAPPVVSPIAAARSRLSAQREPAKDVPVLRDELRTDLHTELRQDLRQGVRQDLRQDVREEPRPSARQTEPVLSLTSMAVATAAAAAHQDSAEMMGELRSMRGLIEQRFGALAFMEKLQRHPRQAQLSQRLLDMGFSPALIRKLVESLPVSSENTVDEMTWAGGVLERNLPTGEREQALEDVGGVYALIGTTGVGKTTSTAKLAAAFAARHGAAELGLITLDAYRVGAHEQLRTYGRILGVPVHTAHDRASLEDLLDLLSAKRMVLIDTAGMAQRDSRTRELLDMISHRSINRLLVVNASAQGETIEDQLVAYGAPACRGIVLSKLDEAVKLGPALDSMIRHRLKVLAIANGQRVPEDWHRLSAHALVQRALKSAPAAAWRLDDQDVSLIFAGLPAAGVAGKAASQPASLAATQPAARA
jgi:flagellar biosynthesis protein FlhF